MILGGLNLGYTWKNKKYLMTTYVASQNVTELEYAPYMSLSLDQLNQSFVAMEMSRAGMISRLTSSGKSFEVMCPCTTNSFVVGVLTGGNAGEWML